MAKDKVQNSSVLTICVEGSPAKNTGGNHLRLQLLQSVFDILNQSDAPEKIDYILMPAGFFFINQHIGDLTPHQRDKTLLKQDFIRTLQSGVRQLRGKYPDLQIVLGIDSHDTAKGCEQFVVATDGTQVTGYSRKLFPVPEEIDAEKQTPMRIYADDVQEPKRFLPSGRRKLFLATCYDIFSLGDAALKRDYRHKSIIRLTQRGARENVSEMENRAKGERKILQRQWHNVLAQEKPDMALVCIHKFSDENRTVYYQRHGIANAAAATGGLCAGAAHFEKLPSRAENAPLSAARVPKQHLYQGDKRGAHLNKPKWARRIDGALLRVFSG